MNDTTVDGLLGGDDWHGRIFSDGWRQSSGGVSAVVEPATGDELGTIGVADADDIARAAAAAHRAQHDWAATPFQERAAVLRRAGNLLESHGEEIRRWIVAESGSIPAKAELETHVAAQECFEAAGLPSRPYGGLLPSEQPRMSLARRRPAGVVAVIAPFNVPLILAIRSVAPALALGNALVLKPDLRTAVCGGVVLARIFELAGLPEGVLHVLAGDAVAGEALVGDPHVRVVSFTGSTAAGRRVGEAAGRHLKRVHLELGGNSAMIVLPDADLDAAVGAAAFGSYLHQGQICMTTGRYLVHRDIAGRFTDALAAKADAIAVGDPARAQVGLGPLIDAGQRDKVHDLVTRSVAEGAVLAAGGRYDRLFYRPTVLRDVPDGAPAWTQEVFGPVAPVTAFDSVDEAVARAADTGYGLSLSIMTREPLAALELADRIPTGIVHINDQTVSDEAHVPFGGVGDSGTGSRFGGAEANVEAFTETQWVTLRADVPRYPF